MIDLFALKLILLAALVASASPGPATLAIAGMSMQAGRRAGLSLAAGVTSGSLMWSVTAALGLSAVMAANAWAFELFRYIGAGYLAWLAVKSARSALTPATAPPLVAVNARGAYAKGLALHLTNPKAILFFGALYSVGVPPGTPLAGLAVVIGAVGLQSALVFLGYALLFSNPRMRAGYLRMRRGFEALFALAFGAAAFKIFTARL